MDGSTVTVSALVALPLTGGVTGVGAYAQARPGPSDAQSRSTADANALIEVMTQVADAEPPAGAERLAGLQVNAKDGTGGSLTARVSAALRASDPLVAVAWNACAPGAVAGSTETVRVLDAVPSEGGVTGLADTAKGELIIAYLTAKSGSSIDVQSIIEHCRKLLSRYKVPDRVYVCEALPLTSTGKLMRRELRAMAEEATLT